MFLPRAVQLRERNENHQAVSSSAGTPASTRHPAESLLGGKEDVTEDTREGSFAEGE